MNVRDLDEIHILKFRPLSVSVLGSLKSMVFLLNNGRLVLGILINDYLRWLKCSSTHDSHSKNVNRMGHGVWARAVGSEPLSDIYGVSYNKPRQPEEGRVQRD